MWTVNRPFQGLALTGGGYRGLFTARVLQNIESHIGQSIGTKFDLICGTSIGGLVALAVAFEIPMRTVVEVFERHGEAIFPPHKPPTSLLAKTIDMLRYKRKPRYSVVPLVNAMLELFPAGATLADAKHAVAIPAVNVTFGKPQVFKTHHKPEWNRDCKFKVIDIALATSAAPTFFELAEVGGSLYADGGLFANAPDLIAVHEAEHFFNVSTEAIRLLSVGTTTQSYSIAYSTGRELGIMDWMERQRLFSVIISAQQQFVGQLISHKLGERYLRIDHEPAPEQTNDLGLDIATIAARKTLLGLADKLVSDILHTRLTPYLAHSPQLKLIREG